MNKLDFLHNEHLRCVYIHRFVYFSSYSLSDKFSLYPLKQLPLDLRTFVCFLFNEVILQPLIRKKSLELAPFLGLHKYVLLLGIGFL
jgi:hypothetical protein